MSTYDPVGESMAEERAAQRRASDPWLVTARLEAQVEQVAALATAANLVCQYAIDHDLDPRDVTKVLVAAGLERYREAVEAAAAADRLMSRFLVIGEDILGRLDVARVRLKAARRVLDVASGI